MDHWPATIRRLDWSTRDDTWVSYTYAAVVVPTAKKSCKRQPLGRLWLWSHAPRGLTKSCMASNQQNHTILVHWSLASKTEGTL